MPDPAVTALLDRARAGDAEAFGRLVGQLYDELRTLAHAQRRRLGASDTVNTTALVHEAYAKLDGRGDGAGPAYADRAHFFRIAARAMRDVIVDYARAQQAAKRGGPGRPVPLDAAGPLAVTGALDPAEVLSLDDALQDLHRLDAEAARVAELRYFAGLTVEETAEALDLSTATVQRRWTVARAWLYRRLNDDAPGA
jgi:RNA polymerase sigma factor (TIGR02999 family)